MLKDIAKLTSDPSMTSPLLKRRLDEVAAVESGYAEVLADVLGLDAVPGVTGLNVLSRPSPPTAVHCVADAQATPFRGFARSIVTTAGLVPALGSNVTSPPVT